MSSEEERIIVSEEIINKRIKDARLAECKIIGGELISCELTDCELNGKIIGIDVRLNGCFGNPCLCMQGVYISPTCTFGPEVVFRNDELIVSEKDSKRFIQTVLKDKTGKAFFGGHMVFADHNPEFIVQHKNYVVLKYPIEECIPYDYYGLTRIIVGDQMIKNEKDFPLNFKRGTIIYTSLPMWFITISKVDPYKKMEEVVRGRNNSVLFKMFQEKDWIDKIEERLKILGIHIK